MQQAHNKKRPIKVAVVIPSYGLIGGAELSAFELAERIAAQSEFDLHVFAMKFVKGNAPITFHKIPETYFPRFLKPIAFAWHVNRKIKSGAFDVVHSHERIFNADVFSVRGIPHEIWIKDVRKKSQSLFDRSTSWVERKGYKSNEAVLLPVSSMVSEKLIEYYNMHDEKLHIMYPGVDLKRFTSVNNSATRHLIRSAYGLKDEDTVVLFVGMNFEIKQLELIVHATAEANKKWLGQGRLMLLAVGKGNEKRYNDMAMELGIEKHIIFAGIRTDVENFYAASDFFVMPSLMDTFGKVVLEAMALKLPVIVSDKVGAKDIVTDGKSGFIIPVDSSPAYLAEVFLDLSSMEKRKLMGEAAFVTARSHDWDEKAAELAEIYKNIADSNRI